MILKKRFEKRNYAKTALQTLNLTINKYKIVQST